MITDMYEKLPQELKERGAFCLWKYEERDGSRTKVPYQTNGLRADSANKATFTDYAIAIRHRAGYDGIGIGVFGDICAIDIDNCVENGVLSDMAEDIIARMDTYTEYSPSGFCSKPISRPMTRTAITSITGRSSWRSMLPGTRAVSSRSPVMPSAAPVSRSGRTL